jgi:hypothetical protein
MLDEANGIQRGGDCNMKKKLPSICIVVIAVFLVAVVAMGSSCMMPSVKTTGGGWFIDNRSEAKITFGFSAILTGEDNEAKGQFQLIDHGTKPPTRVHGTFDELKWVSIFGTSTKFEGECTVNGNGPVYLKVEFTDRGKPGIDPGDEIKVWIDGGMMPDYMGTLEGGNITIHVPKD